MELSMEERCERYNTYCKKVPPLVVYKGCLYGHIPLSRTFKEGNREDGYVGGFMDRIYYLFPDARKVLHVAGYTETNHWHIQDFCTFDNIPALNGEYDLVFVYAVRGYHFIPKVGVFPYINRRKLIDKVLSIVKKKGFIVWIDYTMPFYNKNDLRAVGILSMGATPNARFMNCIILERQ